MEVEAELENGSDCSSCVSTVDVCWVEVEAELEDGSDKENVGQLPGEGWK